MRTVKQVSDLTGISVRTLHYYDEIGLLKPSQITETGYRLYDDEALLTLQQILFFKELDISLKEINEIMASSHFDRINALKNQKELLILKRNRLEGLIELIEKSIGGESIMSFKEFDLSEYYNVLKTFKKDHEEEAIKYFGSNEEFDKLMEDLKVNETSLAQNAIKEFGSIEKFIEYAKKNIANLPDVMKRAEAFKKDYLEESRRKGEELHKKLTADLSKDPSSKEIQDIVKEIVEMSDETHKFMGLELPENQWGLMAELFISNPNYIETNDKKYGLGASVFIGKAFKFYSENHK